MPDDVTNNLIDWRRDHQRTFQRWILAIREVREFYETKHLRLEELGVEFDDAFNNPGHASTIEELERIESYLEHCLEKHAG